MHPQPRPGAHRHRCVQLRASPPDRPLQVQSERRVFSPTGGRNDRLRRGLLQTTLTVMESPPPFPPLQHAASTAAALAGYQPLCPNHCWPRPSVAAVAGEKNSRAVVHSTICLSHVLCSQLCFYATVGGLVRRSLRRLAPRLQIVVQVYDIWRSRTCRSCLRSLITHPYLEFGTCAIAHCL